MRLPSLDLARDLRQVPGLGRGLPVFVVCKGRQAFERLKHRDDSHHNPQRNKFTTPTPLRPLHAEGFVALTAVGERMLEAPQLRWRRDGREPRELAISGDRVLVAEADALSVLDRATGAPVGTIGHPALRALHSVSVCPGDPSRALVSSAGVDALLLVGLDTARAPEIEVVWSGPAHGYDRSRGGVRLLSPGAVPPDSARVLGRRAVLEGLARGDLRAGEDGWIAQQGWEELEHPLGLEYILRGSVPNWAGFGAGEQIYATLFFAGQAIALDRQTGRTRVLLEGLGQPHGALPFGEGLLVTDTLRGRVILLGADGAPARQVCFSGLPVGDSPYHTPYEWLQFTRPLGEGDLLATVDGRRGQLCVWSLQRGAYSLYPMDPSLMVQCIQPAA